MWTVITERAARAGRDNVLPAGVRDRQLTGWLESRAMSRLQG